MYTAAEIIEIIKVCRGNDVSQFKAGDVEVIFPGYKPPVAPSSPDLIPPAMAELQRDMEWFSEVMPKPVLPDEG